MSDMKCSINCPVCGESLQKFGEVDPGAGTSVVLGANCPKCGIGNSDIKLWQELIRTRKALDVALDGLTTIGGYLDYNDCVGIALDTKDKIYEILEQKDEDE